MERNTNKSLVVLLFLLLLGSACFAKVTEARRGGHFPTKFSLAGDDPMDVDSVSSVSDPVHPDEPPKLSLTGDDDDPMDLDRVHLASDKPPLVPMPFASTADGARSRPRPRPRFGGGVVQVLASTKDAADAGRGEPAAAAGVGRGSVLAVKYCLDDKKDCRCCWGSEPKIAAAAAGVGRGSVLDVKYYCLDGMKDCWGSEPKIAAAGGESP